MALIVLNVLVHRTETAAATDTVSTAFQIGMAQHQWTAQRAITRRTTLTLKTQEITGFDAT